jgi:dihydrofolate reductase
VTALQPALAPLALIAAVARNGVIGKDGALPWHVSEDLKHFKKTTDGHVIIMGRKTHDSIGRPLPKRRNIVVTRQTGARFPGCEAAHSLDEAIALARTTDDCPFIIGGASLYKEALPLATELHLTTIDEDVAGDTYFPEDLSEFVEVESRPGAASRWPIAVCGSASLELLAENGVRALPLGILRENRRYLASRLRRLPARRRLLAASPLRLSR